MNSSSTLWQRWLLGLALIALALVTVQCASLSPQGEPGERGFKSIFDGKTLDGWKAADMSFWSIEDGAITAKITKAHPTKRNHYLVYQGGKLADFELKLRHRIVSEHKVNGGFQFRSEMFDGNIPDDCRGYQVDNNTGTPWLARLYDEFGRHTLAFRGESTVFTPEGKKNTTRSPMADEEAWFKLSDWHEYHLICRGTHLTLNINGRLVAEVNDLDPKQQDFSGILAMQLHSGPPMTVQFKDIRVKRLKATVR
jgi:3-keto-disaccharide hydrolase